MGVLALCLVLNFLGYHSLFLPLSFRSIDVQKPRKDKAGPESGYNRSNTESSSLSSTPRSKASTTTRTPGAKLTPRRSNISPLDAPRENGAGGAASENSRSILSNLETVEPRRSSDSVSSVSGPSSPASSSRSVPLDRVGQPLNDDFKPEVLAVPPPPPPPPQSVGDLIGMARKVSEMQQNAKPASLQPEGVKTDFLSSLRQKNEMSESPHSRSRLQNGQDTAPGLREKGDPGENGTSLNRTGVHGRRWGSAGDANSLASKDVSGFKESLRSKAGLGFSKPPGQEEKQEEKMSASSAVQPGINQGALEGIVKEALQDFRESMHKDLQNLHLEMLRQFEAQQEDIREALNESFARFARLVEENEALRKENETLRSIY